jgi:hypothetical protein
MEIIFASTHTAYAAFMAMENLLLNPIVIPEVAIRTEVSPQYCLATDALPARWLHTEANLANDLFDERPIDLMGAYPANIHFLIVAVTAPKNFPTTRSHDAALAAVMSASSLPCCTPR